MGRRPDLARDRAGAGVFSKNAEPPPKRRIRCHGYHQRFRRVAVSSKRFSQSAPQGASGRDGINRASPPRGHRAPTTTRAASRRAKPTRPTRFGRKREPDTWNRRRTKRDSNELCKQKPCKRRAARAKRPTLAPSRPVHREVVERRAEHLAATTGTRGERGTAAYGFPKSGGTLNLRPVRDVHRGH